MTCFRTRDEVREGMTGIESMSVALPAGTQICRYEIPVDSVWHALKLSGPLVQLSLRRADRVEVFAVRGTSPEVVREFKAIGTGEQLDDEVEYIGTALGPTVTWHLVERLDTWVGRVAAVMASRPELFADDAAQEPDGESRDATDS